MTPIFPARFSLTLLCVAALFATPRALALLAQQAADDRFDTKVENPAYVDEHPVILIDEAHRNYHTASGRYKPFAELLTSDGYRVGSNGKSFTPDTLGEIDVLVIANALGSVSAEEPKVSDPAFTAEECEVVHSWVRQGGALLLIADHEPFGLAAQMLAQRFGVEMRNCSTADPFNNDAGSIKHLVFSRDNGLLGEHAVLRGRSDAERIDKVVTFRGQSINGPTASVSLFRLATTANDTITMSNGQQEVRSAAGRVQGLALSVGKGRVVVLGEAAMLTAQSFTRGTTVSTFGMSTPGYDNKQLTLNILHWLSGLFD